MQAQLDNGSTLQRELQRDVAAVAEARPRPRPEGWHAVARRGGAVLTWGGGAKAVEAEALDSKAAAAGDYRGGGHGPSAATRGAPFVNPLSSNGPQLPKAATVNPSEPGRQAVSTWRCWRGRRTRWGSRGSSG